VWHFSRPSHGYVSFYRTCFQEHKAPLPLGAFPEWPTPEGQIRLQLNEWTRLLRIHLGKLEEQCDRVRKILEYFMEEARRNRLGESSAVRILRNCLDELKLTDTDLASDDGTAAKDLWQSRIGQRKIQDVRQNMKYGAFGESPSWLPTDSRLSTSLINKMPLFNLWDSLSFIYTKAVEPIVCQRQAELHLYQFWTIIRILKDCEQYFVSFATPTMAAATWTKERERTKPHIIAFATTCVGQRLDGARAAGSAHSQELDDMQKLRCEHINSLKETLGLTHLEPHRVGTLDGNRPEISSWPSVIDGPGRYLSLCFQGLQPSQVKTVKFCEGETTALLYNGGVEMTDLWDSAKLVDLTHRRNQRRAQYPFCFLQSTEWIVEKSIERKFEDDICYQQLGLETG
jgi:hypothetical protein